MRLGAVALALLLSACASDDEPPQVDWGQVSQAQRNTIDRAVDAGDCAGMQTAFDGSERSDVLEYLDWHMEDAGCY
jgi:hypothetical protein